MPPPDCWLESTLRRVYPASPASAAPRIRLMAARGERVSFQVCARNHAARQAVVDVVARADPDLPVQIRRVGCVAVKHLNTETPEAELEGVGHIPGLAPDPLFPEPVSVVGTHETVAFWVNVSVPDGAAPGVRTVSLTVRSDGEALAPLELRLDVRPLTVPPLQGFPVTHWFCADALCDWYGVRPWDEGFWRIVRPYLADLAAHGSTCQYVPLFTPPTDGVRRPSQLLRVSEAWPGQYRFDFADVARWVRLARECGAQYLEWTHLFSQWGVGHALRVYRDNADDASLLWPPETPATSPVYRGFLAQLLPAFRSFLDREGVLDRSFFHLSDEPGREHLDAYRAARQMLRDLAPWMRVADALSDLDFAREGLTDVPIASIGAAREFAAAGVPSWAYFCCGPRGRYLNRLIDTPLAKIRMAGWLLHRLGAQGFLHWGYNYWYRSQTRDLVDPFSEQSGDAWPGWPYGDPFEVYPGPDGPLDSIRWEAWSEGLRDLALLRAAGVPPDEPLLAEIRGYDDFPWSVAWPGQARERILQSA